METETIELDIEQLRLLIRSLDIYETKLEEFENLGGPIEEIISEVRDLRHEIYQTLTERE